MILKNYNWNIGYVIGVQPH